MDTPAQVSDPVCLDLGMQTLAAVPVELRAHQVGQVVAVAVVEPHISASKALTLL
jgi:hypothetical protein